MIETLPPKEKLAWLRLIRTENVGPVTFSRLLERFGSAEKALQNLPDLAKRGGKMDGIKPYAADAAEKEIDNLYKIGGKLVCKAEADYPPLLAQIEDAPPVISVLGNPKLLSKKSLGVVGARNASLTGRKIAEDFSRKTGAAGYVITSGLARGIDASAHIASLPSGTVAVVAGGINVIYPPENDKLYAQIAESGAIVAESPFNTEPIARHFPRRNRIISGLSLGLLVVEAAAKSGSLITARMALEQNREVFAVPGSPLDPRAEGTNGLLRDGAHMATTAEDIIEVLHSLRTRTLAEPKSGAFGGGPDSPALADSEPSEDLRNRVMECLSPTPVQMDELIRAVNAPVGAVLMIILEMELAGRIERQPGNKVNLI